MQRKTLLLVGSIVVVLIVGVGLWKYHEQPQFCSICHIMRSYVQGWQDSDYLIHAHAENDITCLECHEPTIQQQAQEVIIP